LLPNYVIK